MPELRVGRAADVTVITLDRPPVNALTVALCESLQEAFIALAEDGHTRCVILTGAGRRAFCAGLDLAAFFGHGDEVERNAVLRRTYEIVQQCPVPVIAALSGPAVGAGAVLASVCDLRIAAPGASLRLPEVDVGRIGGAAHLARLLPQGVLRRLVLTGQPLPAADALRLGAFDDVADDPLAAAQHVAAGLAQKSPLLLRATKQSLNEIETLDADEGYACEQARSARLRHSEDAQEAVLAAREKRRPIFTGR